MSFGLVPKSVTLSDLELHNGRHLRYSTEFGRFGHVVEDISIFLRQKESKESSF